jgi:hypothetical protein
MYCLDGADSEGRMTLKWILRRSWYCHVYVVSVTNNNGFWIRWLDLLAFRLQLHTSQSILTAEGSLHSASRSTTDSKRPSLSPVHLRHGPRTENTLRTPYSSNSSTVIEVSLRCRYTETVAFYCCLRIRWRENVFSDPLPSDRYIRYNIKRETWIIIRYFLKS